MIIYDNTHRLIGEYQPYVCPLTKDECIALTDVVTAYQSGHGKDGLHRQIEILQAAFDREPEALPILAWWLKAISTQVPQTEDHLQKEDQELQA
jgi:hypothetical protein